MLFCNWPFFTQQYSHCLRTYLFLRLGIQQAFNLLLNLYSKHPALEHFPCFQLFIILNNAF